MAEHRARPVRAQAGIDAAGLGALPLTTAAGFRHFTGLLRRVWESASRDWFLVIPAAGEPVAGIAGIGTAPMARTWLRDIRSWPAPVGDGVAFVADALCEAGGQVLARAMC